MGVFFFSREKELGRSTLTGDPSVSAHVPPSLPPAHAAGLITHRGWAVGGGGVCQALPWGFGQLQF